MEKLLSFTIFLALSPFLLIAQAPDTVWTKTYGGAGWDQGYSIQQTSDGGYIVVGGTDSFGNDLWLLKTDSQGDTIWTKLYGGINHDGGKVVLQTDDGGYFIGGNTELFGTGNTDIWLLKTDSLGDTTWTKTYGGPEAERCDAAQQTADGGYIITGITESFGSGIWDLWLLKTNQYGDTVWTKIYGGDSFYYAGGNSVQETYDGGYIIAGYLNADGGWVGNAWLLKTDSNGDTAWTKVYERAQFYGIQQTADSGYIICGGAEYMSQILYLVKTNPQGDSLWTKGYGDFQNPGGCGLSLQLTDDNGYIITGQRGPWSNEDDLILFKTNANGDSLWYSVYGGTQCDRGWEVQQTNDGGYIIVGRTNSFGAGGGDFWILKTEPDVGIEEQPFDKPVETYEHLGTTIFSGPLHLPEDKTCKVFDITGRVVVPERIKPGIYFIEIDGKITNKVVKVR